MSCYEMQTSSTIAINDLDSKSAKPGYEINVYVVNDGNNPVISPNSFHEVNGDEDINGKIGVNGIQLQPAVIETKVYLRRWFILTLFVLDSLTNAFQWIQYSIITNIVMEYYHVGSSAVNWTSMIYMIVYIPLIFPAAWLLERKGLRSVVLLGSAGTALGAWIKCGSVSPDRFYVTMIGQTVCAISQIFILGIPPRLAAVWFGQKEVSTACSIGVFGNQLGVALGFLLPPVMVPNSQDNDVVSKGLNIMFFSVAGVTTVLFLLIVLFFKGEPPCPPSPAAAISANETDEKYVRSIYRLMKSPSYLLLLISYGINVGVYYAISTLLNQVFLQYFPGEELNAGRIGLTIVVAGMAGSVVGGVLLDKTHKFKEITLLVYIFSLLGMVAYTFNFMSGLIWVVYVIAGILGFFMTGYLPVGFEFAAEITYPESEGTSSGLLNASAQLFGIIFTLGGSWILTDVTDIASNLTLSGALLVGTVMTAFVKPELKRQAAQNAQSTVVTEDKSSLKENSSHIV